jgi:hypothetical protein
MKMTVEQCLDIARDCEERALGIPIPALRETYLVLARQWRGAAKCLAGQPRYDEHDVPRLLN